MNNFFRFIQVCIFAGILLLASHIYFLVKNVDRIMDLVNTNIQRQDNLEARVNTWGLIIHTALNDHDMIQASGGIKSEKHYGRR